MATPTQPSADELRRLAEQQAKFNAELEKSQDLLEKIEKIDSGIATQLKKQLTSANELNIKHGIGKDILSKASSLQEKAEVKINILQQDRDRLLKKYAKAKSEAAKEEIENQLLSTTAQLKFQQSLEESLRSLHRAAEEEKKITAEKRKQESIQEKLKKKVEEVNAKYFATAAVFKFLLDAAFKADKQTTDLAKSLGISKDQARGLRQEFVQYARATNDAFVTTDKLVEANSELQQQLGVSIKYTSKQAEDFSRLTKLMGLSAEQAGKLARMSIVNGKSIEDTTKSIIKGSAASQRTNKIAVDQREVLKDVANLSESILIKFQGNPEALGAAVVQAKKLGLSLEQVDKIGDSMLEWESSIQNELEAELMTGKQLNFERARAAALTGDQATLMQEVANQAGSLAEFQGMNVLAQQSLAKAFGMSRDEMSKMLLDQEKINKLGDVSQMTLDQQLESLKAQGEPLDSVLYKQIQQQSAQEKFNNAMEKLSDILGNLISGPFGKLLDIISNILQNTYALAAISAVYITRLGLILALKAKELSMSRKQATTDAADTAAKTAGSAASMGPLGWILAGAAALSIFGILSAMLSKGDDVVSPGYGKRMLLDKGSVTAFNDNDTIVAGTNLGGSGGGGGSNMALVAAINELHSTVKSTANKPAVAVINGKDAFADSIGRSASLGTSQNINNSYKLA